MKSDDLRCRILFLKINCDEENKIKIKQQQTNVTIIQLQNNQSYWNGIDQTL